MKPFPLAVALATAAGVVLVSPSIAHACGACFAPPTSPTVVSGHRMVMSISGQQTVLWDQIQYQGEPEDFAWVLPVKPGARIEEATDAFFEALEATTQTTVTGIPLNCGFNSYLDGGDGCSFGCGDDAAGDDGGGGATMGAPQNPVDVVHEGSVGPYETVTLSTMVPGALNVWLTDHGYNVDPTSQPIIDQYVSEGYDFIALRLSPGLGIKQMKPVRIVMPGGGLTLPLRMVAIGTGAQTPIVLYLIGEGRYTIENLTEVSVSSSDIAWDHLTNTSNYESLRALALSQNDGKSFVTSAAIKGFFTSASFGSSGANGPPGAQGFLAIYDQTAKNNGESALGCQPSPDGGITQVTDPCPGFDFDSPECDAMVDMGTDARRYGCEGAYDVSRALVGMHPRDVWVTRTEMILPREALATDLAIKAGAQQSVSNQITATKEVNKGKACGGFPGAAPGWERLQPPNRPTRPSPFFVAAAALALLMRRALRGKRWFRPTTA